VIAIDILIEPDRAMTEKAKSVNARLRRNHPDGFAFDESHVPHITLAQRYVRASDLDGLASALTEALRSGPTLPLELRATGYASNASSTTSVVVCVVQRSLDLLELASKVLDAVRPYAVAGGTANAFFGAPGEEIDPETIRYVEDFEPACTGQRYDPHVTLGAGRPDFVERLSSEPFEEFTFSGPKLAIYQLGNFGTARKLLWSMKRQE
jgi:hypothetical protein